MCILLAYSAILESFIMSSNYLSFMRILKYNKAWDFWVLSPWGEGNFGDDNIGLGCEYCHV